MFSPLREEVLRFIDEIRADQQGAGGSFFSQVISVSETVYCQYSERSNTLQNQF